MGELRMLRTLGFNFSRPHPLHFLRRNSKAGDVDVLQHTLAKYLVEIALPEYTLAHIPPSLLAIAALYLSLMIQEPGASLSSVWSPTLQYYSTYRPDDILPVVSSLASVVGKRGDQAEGRPHQVLQQEVHEGGRHARACRGNGRETGKNEANSIIIRLRLFDDLIQDSRI